MVWNLSIIWYRWRISKFWPWNRLLEANAIWRMLQYRWRFDKKKLNPEKKQCETCLLLHASIMCEKVNQIWASPRWLQHTTQNMQTFLFLASKLFNTFGITVQIQKTCFEIWRFILLKIQINSPNYLFYISTKT